MTRMIKYILLFVFAMLTQVVTAQAERVIFCDDFSSDAVGDVPHKWMHSMIEEDSIANGEISHSIKPIRQAELKVVMKNGSKAMTYVPGLKENTDYLFLPFEPAKINRYTSETATDIFPTDDGWKIRLPKHYKLTMEIFIGDTPNDNINYSISFNGHNLVVFGGKGNSRKMLNGTVKDDIPVKPNTWNKLIVEYNHGEVCTVINGKQLTISSTQERKGIKPLFSVFGYNEKVFFIKSLKIVEL